MRRHRCALSLSDFKIHSNCNFVGLLHHPFWLYLVLALLTYIFNSLNLFLWLRITDKGSVPEMRIWSISLIEIKDTTESMTSASYLDLLLSIGRDGQLHTSIYDKRDDFNFHITNFPFLSSNIPSSPAYGVFISQLIRYARACSSYECFIPTN